MILELLTPSGLVALVPLLAAVFLFVSQGFA